MMEMNAAENAVDEPANPATDEGEIRSWMREIEASKKREKHFREEGNKLVKLYEGEKKGDNPFHILYSNTETLLPALYSNLPKPIVSRRFKDKDPLGLASSKATQRMLEYSLDTNSGEYPGFDELMEQATLEGLVPGRGITRFKYEAELAEQPAEKLDAEEGEVSTPTEAVKSESVCGEHVPWDRFLHGYAKRWYQVPWISILHFMDREELKRNFGEVGAVVPVSAGENSDDSDTDDWKMSKEESGGTKLAAVFEIWDKLKKEVLFICPDYPRKILKRVPDPLGLTGFFPVPQPLKFFNKISTLTPVALYTFYQEQATELNVITIRIKKLISALKVRGFYDSTVEDIEKVLEAEDNVLVPAQNVAALQQGQSLEKAIWLMPIEKLVAVVQQLYVAREQTKQVIYEITGISDILRGASVASETATAQNIKNQWGTLRLKKMQKAVMRYSRECLRIMAEIGIEHFSEQTMREMTGLPYPTKAEQAQAQQQMQVMQQQAQAQQQMLPPGSPPPQPPQVDPKLQETLSMPTWEDILGMLRDNLQRSYRIDIETNSTVEVEATEDKQNISELLNALAQFLSGIGPLVADGTMPFDAAKSIMLAIVRRFRFGGDVEESLMSMQAPQPKGPDPADQMKLEGEKMKQAGEKQKADILMQTEALRQQGVQKQLAIDERRMTLEMEYMEREHMLKMEELDRKAKADTQAFEMKLATIRQQAATSASSESRA